jgi:hypothetical protein
MSREYVAAVCQSSSASLGFSAASDETPIPDCVIGAANGLVYGVAKFSPATTNAVQGHFKLPSIFHNLTLDIESRSSEAPGSVVWQVQGACVGVGELSNITWSEPQSVAVASPGISDRLESSQIDSLNAAGCAADKRFFFRFFRDPAHPSDDFESPAELISLRFTVR